MMKKLAYTVALLSCYATAQAASSVTLYGIADVSLRYLSTGNGPAAPDSSRISMENGAIASSRWGMRGTEDLGDGVSAFFQLENGFNLQNGQQSDPGSLFNRYALVGLNGGEIGALSFGNQDSPMFTTLIESYDPLTVGNYTQNAWLPVAMSYQGRANSVRYRNNKLGPFDLILSYAFGNDVKDHQLGQQYGGTLSYTDGPFSIGGGYQTAYSNKNSDYTQRVWNLNTSYKLDSVKLFAGYFNGRDQTGWVNTVLGNGIAVNGLARKDHGYYLGAAWQATAQWSLSGAAYYDRARNVAVQDDHGKRLALVGVAEYSLSKRTQVYGTVDYNKVYDASVIDLASRNSQVGVGLGLRHIF